MSLVIFALIAKWHVYPGLKGRNRDEALILLFWVHAFRYMPLTLFAPGQASPELPTDAVEQIAYGDLVSSVLALLAIIALKRRWASGIGIAWFANVFGFVDYLAATGRGISIGMFEHYLGWSWYILNFYTPMLLVCHVMIFALLRRRS